MAQYQLTMQTGPNPGKVFPLEGEDLTIGREAGNPLTINDAEISRKHAHLYLQGGKYVIEDLGSTNGTFVNGSRLASPHVLRPGEVISFGEQITLVFETVADPNATMMSAKPTAAPLRPAAAPAPAPAYTSRASEAPAPMKPAGANRTPLIIAGVVVLCAICACAFFLYYIDANSLWCTYFPFLFGGACG